jgi:hypothetical protein
MHRITVKRALDKVTPPLLLLPSGKLKCVHNIIASKIWRKSHYHIPEETKGERRKENLKWQVCEHTKEQ